MLIIYRRVQDRNKNRVAKNLKQDIGEQGKGQNSFKEISYK